LFRSPQDVEGDGLIGVAAEASDFEILVSGIEAPPSVGDGCAGPLKASMRLFHASTASRSASLRASAACSAVARTDAP
jgi:hypothetical protein